MSAEAKIDTVLSRLRGVKPKQGRENAWMARCPAHDDRSPSLDVHLGSKWINLNCFAGCSYDSIRLAIGLEWKDLVVDSDEKRPRRRVTEREYELTAMACCLRLQNEPAVLRRLRDVRGWPAPVFEQLGVGWEGTRLTLPVRDAQGKLHDILRYDPFIGSKRPELEQVTEAPASEAWMSDWQKGNKPASPPPRKVLAGRGKTRLPWPAPEQIKVDTLLVVEGEGTAISLHSVGIKAVALPGSMRMDTNVSSPGAWRAAGWHRSWAKRFERFKFVVCIPDCDGPGRALMGAVRYDLQKLGVNTSIVDLGPKTWDGSDIADMMLSTANSLELRRAAKEAVHNLIAEEAEVLVA